VKITLEPASPDDHAFVFQVTEETMRAYVEETFGAWDADAQRGRSREMFDPHTCRIILIDRDRAGLLVVEDRADEIFLAKIYLRRQFQRRGVGTSLIRDLIGRARAAGKPLRLRVLRVNPARSLYERLGFVVTGSTETHHVLEHRSEGG